MADNYLYSAPINIVRYRNGTLLKLMASTHEFKSYDYDAEKNTGTFSPDFITIVCKVEGDISIGQWSYSTDGSSWSPVIDGRHGMTIYDNRLVLSPESDLYKPSNSNITIMCTANTGGYYDTITIVRTIDPIVTFSKIYTDLKLEEDRIFAIASKEQLEQFMESEEYRRGESFIDVTSAGIELSVSSRYATKAESKADAQNAVDDLFEDGTDGRLAGYNSLVESVADLEIDSQNITARVYTTERNVSSLGTQVSRTIVSDTLWYLASNRSSGVTREDTGWTTNPTSESATMTSTKRYLWMYHTYTYTGGDSASTNPFVGGVYGNTGNKGDTGDKGNTGVGITEATPLYYVSASSTYPSKPQSEVTTTSTSQYNTWTKGVPEVDDTHIYLFTCDQIKYDNNTINWTDVVLNNAIASVSSRLKTAELKITDEGIVSAVKREIGDFTIDPQYLNLLLYTNAANPYNNGVTQMTTGSGSIDWLELSDTPDSNIRYGARFDVPGTGSQNRAMLQWYASRSAVTLERGKTYVFSFYYRIVEGEDAGIFIGRGGQWPSGTIIYSGPSEDWTHPALGTWGRFSVALPNVSADEDDYVYFGVNYSNEVVVEMCGFKVEETNGETSPTIWNNGTALAPVVLPSTQTVESIIDQSADAIRLKARTIAWEAENSSMSEDGHLECENANIKGRFETGIGLNDFSVAIDENQILCLDQNGNMQGRLEFALFEDQAGLYIESTGETVLGVGENLEGAQVHLVDDQMTLRADTLITEDSANNMMGQALTLDVPITYNLQYHSSSRTYTWNNATMRFINGIFVGYVN